MIEFIKVKGFKSLYDFELNLKQGLNILVGPNGSGKTNIVHFFEFISYLTYRDLTEAVSLMGGVGSIFTKIGDSGFTKNINVLIRGLIPLSLKRKLIYQYKFNIEVSTEKALIYFRNQRLQIRRTQKSTSFDKIDFGKLRWSIDVEQDIDDKLNPKIIFNKFTKKFLYTNFKNEKEYRVFESSLSNRYFTTGHRSLIQFLNRYVREDVDEIFMDLRGGENFNIVPSRVKQPEDIAKEPGVEKDGCGLAVTLYSIKNLGKNYEYRHRYTFRPPYTRLLKTDIFKKIVDLVKLANPSIKDLDVVNNPFDNQLLVKLHVRTEEEDIILPLSSMSDGTIKWICLITAIFTTRNIFSIEEPENFLHPWMQSEFIKLIKNQFEYKSHKSFILMSTHSETIINNIEPSDLVLVSMQNGITHAKKIQDLSTIKSEINETGFGLGYYYYTGVLSNV